MQQKRITQYFPGGNTALGFYSYWDSNINDLDRLIILKGGPGTGKSTLLDKILREFAAEDWETELLWCSSDAESLDGVIFRKISLGIIDGMAPHLRDPHYPGVIDRLINLGDYWSEQILLQNKEEIIALTNENRSLFQKTYQTLAEAKKHHDDLENLYQAGMNWEALSTMTEELVQQLFSSYPLQEKGKERHRFLSALTPQGPVNYMNELLKLAAIRYIVKGRAGTGKSTLLKRVAQEARKKGFAVDYYHCGFDPLSIDSIYIPELGICMLDGTEPHEIDPSHKDIVIELFSFMSGEVYSNNLPAIKETNALYQNNLQEALNTLKSCKAVHDQLEKYYAQAMDFHAVEGLATELIAEIQDYARKK